MKTKIRKHNEARCEFSDKGDSDFLLVAKMTHLFFSCEPFSLQPVTQKSPKQQRHSFIQLDFYDVLRLQVSADVA